MELLPDIHRAFGDDLADPFFISPAHAEELIHRNHANPDDIGRGRSRALIGSVIDEIKWWACFNEKKPSPSVSPPPTPQVAPPAAVSGTPVAVRTGPKVGRNDPCPCGSGKKYKKCCQG